MTEHEQATQQAVTRRTALLGAAAVAAAPSGPALAQARAQRIIAYVGTYTDRGKGIHVFGVNTETGKLTLPNDRPVSRPVQIMRMITPA